MSEQLSNHEKEQLPAWFDTCNSCKVKYPLLPDNTLYVHFERQQECNYLVCKCTNCSKNTLIFDEDVTAHDALARDIMVDDDDQVAPEHIYQAWLEVRGIELVQSYELTSRMEKLIAHFGDTLNKMPPDLLMEGFENPNPGLKPYPLRWITD